VGGADDRVYTPQQKIMYLAARHAGMNVTFKAAKDRIAAEWWSYPEAPLELTGQIHQISQKWMADKGLPEMGFTLGGLDELNDPDIRCLIAVDADRKVHGITSWMPVYAGGRPVGWTLDFLRRNTDPGTFRGVMEFLIATAALTFQEEGAPLRQPVRRAAGPLDRGEHPSALQRLLDTIAITMEPVYGFQSLLRFKAKFQPVCQPLYLTYPDPAALGSIATAICRGYPARRRALVGAEARGHSPMCWPPAGPGLVGRWAAGG